MEKPDTNALGSHSFPGYGRAVKVLWFASWCLLSKSSKLPSSDGEILEMSISGLNFKWEEGKAGFTVNINASEDFMAVLSHFNLRVYCGKKLVGELLIFFSLS